MTLDSPEPEGARTSVIRTGPSDPNASVSQPASGPASSATSRSSLVSFFSAVWS